MVALAKVRSLKSVKPVPVEAVLLDVTTPRLDSEPPPAE